VFRDLSSVLVSHPTRQFTASILPVFSVSLITLSPEALVRSGLCLAFLPV